MCLCLYSVPQLVSVGERLAACDAEDVRWLAGPILGREDPWDGEVRYASSYFDAIYEVAEHLIKKGKAYVDSLSAEEIREVSATAAGQAEMGK